MVTFSKYLIETHKGMLDISIPSVQRALKTNKAIQQFLTHTLIGTEKVDGTKLTIIRNKEDYDPDPTKNWYVSYKTNRIFSFEYNHTATDNLPESFGFSQYRVIWDTLKRHHAELKDIPKNTEFFMEFIMRKPTLLRTYTENHKVILINYSKDITYELKEDKIITTSKTPIPDNELKRDKVFNRFASVCGFSLPVVVFEGSLNGGTPQRPVFNESGLQGSLIKAHYNAIKDSVTDAFKPDEEGEIDYQKIILALYSLFTNYRSHFGMGVVEGTVFFDEDNQKRYKLVNEDQYSRERRIEVKKGMEGDLDERRVYFKQVDAFVDDYLKTLDLKNQTLQTLLRTIAKDIYTRTQFPISSPSLTLINIQDDVYRRLRTMVIGLRDHKSAIRAVSHIKENNWGFFIGKIRFPSKAHFDIIGDILSSHPGAVIALVDTKKPSLSFEDREAIIRKKFPNAHLEFIEVPNANLKVILLPFANKVSTIYCGEDNQLSYQKQIADLNERNHTHFELFVKDRDVNEEGSKDEVSSSEIQRAVEDDDKARYKELTDPLMQTDDIWKKIKDRLISDETTQKNV